MASVLVSILVSIFVVGDLSIVNYFQSQRCNLVCLSYMTAHVKGHKVFAGIIIVKLCW